MWYSNKSHQYEDSLLSSRLLKVIAPCVGGDTIKNEGHLKSYESFVRFKTAQFESGKKKSALKQTEYLATKNKKTITANLSFVSPVMQVVGTVKSEIKEPLVDLKIGERRRFISKLLIKCKYFNSLSDKFSEALIPIEALEFIQEINSGKLDFIKKTIEDKGYLKALFSIAIFRIH
jgi:hypothetical protein